MSEVSFFHERDEGATLTVLRAHAAKIAALLESPGFSNSNVRIWRALFIAHGEPVAATISQIQGAHTSCMVQRSFGHNFMSAAGQASREGFTDPNITPTEMAVFMGLEDVEPSTLEWTEQKVSGKLIAAYGSVDSRRVLH